MKKSYKAYVQCDWAASKASGDLYDPDLGKRFHQLLAELESSKIVNVATWADTSKTEAYRENDRSYHAIRNCREVDGADLVVSLLMRKRPTHLHWGSISVMAYALGQDKPCFVIAEDDCVAWKHHMMYHPKVHRITSVDEIVGLL